MLTFARPRRPVCSSIAASDSGGTHGRHHGGGELLGVRGALLAHPLALDPDLLTQPGKLLVVVGALRVQLGSQAFGGGAILLRSTLSCALVGLGASLRRVRLRELGLRGLDQSRRLRFGLLSGCH